MMVSGIYLVSFVSGTNSFGEGIAIVNNGFVNGGDASYYYRGPFTYYGDDIKATVEVRHYRGPLNSVLGPLKQFVLTLTGKNVGDNFEVSGGIQGMPGPAIKIVGTKIADVAG